MNKLVHAARRQLRSFGYDVVRFPSRISLAGHLKDLFTSLSINCVIDVGAHFGEYGLVLREFGYTGQIISFEPVAQSYAVLERQCSRDGRWSAHQLALGSAEGYAAINVTRVTELCSFLPSTGYADAFFRMYTPDNEVQSTENVKIERLDNIFDKIVGSLPDPNVYLKLDTQGWDLEVLKGADACLERVCALQSEVSVKPIYEGMPTYVEAISYMNSKGFELTGLFPVIRDLQNRVIEFDCMMVRTS